MYFLLEINTDMFTVGSFFWLFLQKNSVSRFLMYCLLYNLQIVLQSCHWKRKCNLFQVTYIYLSWSGGIREEFSFTTHTVLNSFHSKLPVQTPSSPEKWNPIINNWDLFQQTEISNAVIKMLPVFVGFTWILQLD